jgi:pyruvate dehydrogenase E2 component (dihydrolipoamide acetyltransferase)
VYEFKLPDLGEGIHEGEVLKWHVQPGDAIREDDPLVDVETDKAAVTIPSPRRGRVSAIHGAVGQSVSVGTVIAVIDDTDGAATATPPASTPKPAAEPKPAVEPRVAPPPAAPSAAPSKTSGVVLAAPATRRLAREMGVDLAQVRGTGPAGRVTPEDIKQAAAGGGAGYAAADEVEAPRGPAVAAGAPTGIPYFELEPLPNFAEWGPVERQPVRSIRRKVARKMVTSMVLVPHVAHMDEADVTELETFRQRQNVATARAGDRPLTLLPFVMKAVTIGLREAPAFNASLDPFSEEIVFKKFYNIGFAADTGKGLVVPVVKHADSKSIRALAAEIVELATRAREEKLQVADLRGGTFTLTNVGAIGGINAIPTINYPEVAILATGRVQEKPVVRDGQIVIRKMLPVTLTFDHRVIDGADAARFVTALVRRLSEPLSLLVEL